MRNLHSSSSSRSHNIQSWLSFLSFSTVLIIHNRLADFKSHLNQQERGKKRHMLRAFRESIFILQYPNPICFCEIGEEANR